MLPHQWDDAPSSIHVSLADLVGGERRCEGVTVRVQAVAEVRGLGFPLALHRARPVPPKHTLLVSVGPAAMYCRQKWGSLWRKRRPDGLEAIAVQMVGH
jgi:hypothetical protein